VGAGQSVGEVYGASVMEIIVPLRDEQLQWFNAGDTVSGISTTDDPAPATIRADFSGRVHQWTGHVARVEGRINPASRMVHVVIEVAGASGDAPNPRLTLIPGMFVEVAIAGCTLSDVATLPRHAVHAGDQVWIADQGKLRIASVKRAYADRRNVYIRQGLQTGDQVIVSHLDVVSDGMVVRIAPKRSTAVTPDEQTQP